MNRKLKPQVSSPLGWDNSEACFISSLKGPSKTELHLATLVTFTGMLPNTLLAFCNTGCIFKQGNNCFCFHADKYCDSTMSSERASVADMSEPASSTSGLTLVVNSWPAADCRTCSSLPKELSWLSEPSSESVPPGAALNQRPNERALKHFFYTGSQCSQ